MDNSALSIGGIPFFELVQYTDLDSTCVAILWYGTNDFDGDPVVGFGVESFDNLAKRSLAQQSHDAVYEGELEISVT